MKKLIPFLILLIATCAAQELPVVEQSFLTTLQSSTQLQKRISRLDSLLMHKATEIEGAKKAQPRSESTIKSLMSEGIALSDSMANYRKKLADIQKQLKQEQQQLGALYRERIKTLRETLADVSAEQAVDINRRIDLLSHKYLLLNPALQQLSFDPERIEKINLAIISDPIERDILTAFLQKANMEVNERLKQIRSNREELEPLIRLNEKRQDFLAEVNDDNFTFFGGSGIETATSDELRTTSGFSSDEHIQSLLFEQNANSIALFFGQLEISNFQEADLSITDSSLNAGRFSSGEYLKLLKEIEKQLSSMDKKIRRHLDEAQ
ncbi:MAG: hypothetical protein ACRBF0_08740 [Calditrichia bacterium]